MDCIFYRKRLDELLKRGLQNNEDPYIRTSWPDFIEFFVLPLVQEEAERVGDDHPDRYVEPA